MLGVHDSDPARREHRLLETLQRISFAQPRLGAPRVFEQPTQRRRGGRRRMIGVAYERDAPAQPIPAVLEGQAAPRRSWWLGEALRRAARRLLGTPRAAAARAGARGAAGAGVRGGRRGAAAARAAAGRRPGRRLRRPLTRAFPGARRLPRSPVAPRAAPSSARRFVLLARPRSDPRARFPSPHAPALPAPRVHGAVSARSSGPCGRSVAWAIVLKSRLLGRSRTPARAFGRSHERAARSFRKPAAALRDRGPARDARHRGAGKAVKSLEKREVCGAYPPGERRSTPIPGGRGMRGLRCRACLP